MGFVPKQEPFKDGAYRFLNSVYTQLKHIILYSSYIVTYIYSTVQNITPALFTSLLYLYLRLWTFSAPATAASRAEEAVETCHPWFQGHLLPDVWWWKADPEQLLDRPEPADRNPIEAKAPMFRPFSPAGGEKDIIWESYGRHRKGSD